MTQIIIFGLIIVIGLGLFIWIARDMKKQGQSAEQLRQAEKELETLSKVQTVLDRYHNDPDFRRKLRERYKIRK